jgi:trans-aconitate 2-methyltransferase
MNSEKDRYQWDAEDYRESSSQQKKWGRELLSKLRLEGHESILDIGCGDGKLAAEMTELLPAGRVLGIDSSPEMIDLARTTFPPADYPNLSWEVKDARELDYNGEFDIVFSNAVLHWVPDHAPVLRGVKEALKPGGRLLFQMGGAGNAADVVEAMAVLLGREEWGVYFHDFSLPYRFCGPGEYEDWLREAGLAPIRAELVPKDMTHEGPEGLAAWIRTTWLPFTQRIPEELREDFIAELVGGFIALHPPDDTGLVHVRAIRLEVEAENPR